MASEESKPAYNLAKDYADHAYIFKEKIAILDIDICPNLAKFDREVKYVSSWF